jgi:DNA-binding beta-propeller fold protein YncE
MKESTFVTASKRALASAAPGFLLIFLSAGCAARPVATAAVQAMPSAWQTNASATSAIEVQGWAKPEQDWLYVLDPQPIKHGLSGRVWLLDPDSGKIAGTISTGADPDFALSPDGSRLFVASRGDDQQSNLAEIDTSNGKILESATIHNRVVANGIPPYSSMAISRDGMTLRVLTYDPNAPVHDAFQLVAYDTASGDRLPANINLGACGYGRFIDYPSANEFDYLCPQTNRIRHVTADAQSRDTDNAFVVLPWVRRLGVAQAFVPSGSKEMTIVRGDDAIYTMDLDSASFAPTKIPGDLQGRILPAMWPTSPDGSRLYIGYSQYPNTRFYLDFDRSATDSPRTQTVNELRVFDTGTWRWAGTIKTSAPFWTAASAANGKIVYVTSPESHSVLAIDIGAMRETRSLPIGGTPSLLIVAP